MNLIRKILYIPIAIVVSFIVTGIIDYVSTLFISSNSFVYLALLRPTNCYLGGVVFVYVGARVMGSFRWFEEGAFNTRTSNFLLALIVIYYGLCIVGIIYSIYNHYWWGLLIYFPFFYGCQYGKNKYLLYMANSTIGNDTDTK